MPYIAQDKRKLLNQHITAIAEIIRKSQPIDADRNGQMNYTVSQLINLVYGPNWRYASINDVVGMISCVHDEFYAKVALPYEKKKEDENGTVYG
jgi:hypothetical protein